MTMKDPAVLVPEDEETIVDGDNVQQLPIVTYAQLLPSTFCSLTLSRRPEDIVVAVMGVTGSGKATFVNHLSDFPLSIGHGLNSC